VVIAFSLAVVSTETLSRFDRVAEQLDTMEVFDTLLEAGQLTTREILGEYLRRIHLIGRSIHIWK
jgi:hypothetical protein